MYIIILCTVTKQKVLQLSTCCLHIIYLVSLILMMTLWISYCVLMKLHMVLKIDIFFVLIKYCTFTRNLIYAAFWWLHDCCSTAMSLFRMSFTHQRPVSSLYWLWNLLWKLNSIALIFNIELIQYLLKLALEFKVFVSWVETRAHWL